MNIIDIQDDLKNLPENALMQEFQQPTGNAPQFLILGELKRRKQMREDYQRQQNSDMKTVAEETITGAGVPQEGIMQMSRAMTPKTNMAQDTGIAQATPVQPTQAPQPQMMSDGGIIRLAPGGFPDRAPNVTSGFGSNIEYTYDTFLKENYFNDTPETREMFLKYKKYMDTREPPSDPQLFNELNFDKSPREPDELGRDVDSEVSNFLSNSGSLTRPEMPTMPGGLSTPRIINFDGVDTPIVPESFTEPEAVQELPVFDATVPEPANPTEDSILNQLRSSVYSNNPLAGPVANALGSVDLDLGSLMPNTEEYYSQFPLNRQDNMNTVEDSGLEGEVFNAMLSRGQNVLPAPPALPEPPTVADSPFSNVPRFNPDSLQGAVDRDRELGGGIIPSSVGGETIPSPVGDGTSDITSAEAIRDNVDLLYGGRGDLYNRGMAGQVSSVASMSDAEILAIAGDPSNDLYGRSLEQMGIRGMDFGEQPIIKADINTMNANKALSAAQRRLRAATTEQEKRAAMNVIAAAEAGVKKAEADRVDVPTSILETPFKSGEIGTQQNTETATTTGGETATTAGGETETIDGDTGLSFGENFQSLLNPRATADELSFGDNLSPIANGLPSIAGELGYNTGTGVGTASKSVPTTKTTSPDGAGFGSLDSRIATMLSERQKQSESDKWMALAQAGFQIMSSKSPTLLGAIGEGGQAGLQALGASKKGAQDFETDMLKLQTQRDIAQQRARSSSLKDGRTSATAYAALERAYGDALTAATENPSGPNLSRLKELESMIRGARGAQFGAVANPPAGDNVIKAPSAQT